MKNDYLAIYVSDHLAMLVGEIEVIERCLRANEKTKQPPEELVLLLRSLLGEVKNQQAVLRAFARANDMSENQLKNLGGWLAEKAGRLKLNGQLTGYSPLSRLLEIEGMVMAAQSRTLMWTALESAEPLGSDLRASEWTEQSESHRQQLAQLHKRLRAMLDPHE